MDNKSVFAFEPIGFIQTCFNEKFGVPRQSGMIKSATGILKLKPEPRFRDAVRTLEQFSHLWLIFVFDRNENQDWRPLISPPRLDAPARVGVFASRSPHRPNPIGLSAVKIEKIDENAPGGIELHLSGVDLLNGTAILDIKPYVPYVDSISEARGAWTESVIPKYTVNYSETALSQIQNYPEPIKNLLDEMLELDPRPTAQKKTFPLTDPQQEGAKFAFRIFDFDLKYEIHNQGFLVTELVQVRDAETVLRTQSLNSLKS